MLREQLSAETTCQRIPLLYEKKDHQKTLQHIVQYSSAANIYTTQIRLLNVSVTAEKC